METTDVIPLNLHCLYLAYYSLQPETASLPFFYNRLLSAFNYLPFAVPCLCPAYQCNFFKVSTSAFDGSPASLDTEVASDQAEQQLQKQDSNTPIENENDVIKDSIENVVVTQTPYLEDSIIPQTKTSQESAPEEINGGTVPDPMAETSSGKDVTDTALTDSVMEQSVDEVRRDPTLQKTNKKASNTPDQSKKSYPSYDTTDSSQYIHDTDINNSRSAAVSNITTGHTLLNAAGHIQTNTGVRMKHEETVLSHNVTSSYATPQV